MALENLYLFFLNFLRKDQHSRTSKLRNVSNVSINVCVRYIFYLSTMTKSVESRIESRKGGYLLCSFIKDFFLFVVFLKPFF